MEWKARWLTGLLVIVGCQAPAMEEGIATIPLSAGDGYTCAITGPPADAPGNVVCWGRNDVGQASAPAAVFQQINAGTWESCALDGEGNVSCWGADPDVPDTVGRLVQLSTTEFRSCGISAVDGSIRCWGSVGEYGEHSPPEGSFTQVSVARDHSCALAADGAIECWGNGPDSVLTPPKGSFVQVSAGTFHTCALTTDGEVECWGGVDTKPSEDSSFVSVSVSLYSSCGLTTEGTVECWGGANTHGEASPPSGQFAYLDCGHEHACAMAEDGSVECWGNDEDGESTPP